MKKFLITTFLLLSFLLFNKNSFAQEEELEPILIIPGIMASWNWQQFFDRGADSWDFTPVEGKKVYQPMISFLEENGYVLDENLFIVFYDWRDSNYQSMTDFLLPAIENVKQNSPTGKVQIIAHSMGGLVARHYIQSDLYQNDISNLVMLATPNRGASDSYLLWAGGMNPPFSGGLEKFFGNIFLWLQEQENNPGLALTKQQLVQRDMKSVAELLPVYDFLIDGSTGELIPTNTLNNQNPVLNNLNHLDENNLEADGLNDLYNRVDRLIVLGGDDVPTIKNIIVDKTDVGLFGNWSDGRPDKDMIILDSVEGDNTVLTESSLLPFMEQNWTGDPPVLVKIFNKVQNFVFPEVLAEWVYEIVFGEEYDWYDFFQKKIPNAGHRSIVADSIPTLSEQLDLPNYTPQVEDSELSDNTISFLIASPVLPTITSPDGKIISRDQNTIGDNALYIDSGDEMGPKIILIEDPISGDYQIDLLAITDGDYSLGIYQTGIDDEFDNLVDSQNQGESFLPTVTGQVENGQNYQHSVTVDEDGTMPEIDKEKDGTSEEEIVCRSLKNCLSRLVNIVKKYIKSDDIDNKFGKNIKQDVKNLQEKYLDNLEKYKDHKKNKKYSDIKKVNFRFVNKTVKEIEKEIEKAYKKDQISEQAFLEISDILSKLRTFSE